MEISKTKDGHSVYYTRGGGFIEMKKREDVASTPPFQPAIARRPEAREVQRKAELDNKRRAEAQRDAYVDRILAEAKYRRERDERLRNFGW